MNYTEKRSHSTAHGIKREILEWKNLNVLGTSQSHAQVATNPSSGVCMRRNMRLSALYLRLTPYCSAAHVCGAAVKMLSILPAGSLRTDPTQQKTRQRRLARPSITSQHDKLTFTMMYVVSHRFQLIKSLPTGLSCSARQPELHAETH